MLVNMAVGKKLMQAALLFTVLLLLGHIGDTSSEWVDCSSSCSHADHNIDLEFIKGEWDMLDVDTGNIYWLRLCGNASKCQDAHLCANTSKTASATLTELGNHDNCKMMYSTESKTLHFSFTYTNAPPFKDSRVNVTLTCGNHLGIPSIIQAPPISADSEDIGIIEWITNAVCPKDSDKRVEENKCYFVERGYSAKSGFVTEVYDLTPLIMNTGGYRVNSPDHPGVNMIVNPCRAISNPSSDKKCENGVACRLDDSDKVVAMFDGTVQLDLKNDQLQLHYPLKEEKSSCSSKTGLTIHFNCPVGDVETEPVLTFFDSNHCYHEILWYTDNACGWSKVRRTVDSKGCFLPQVDNPDEPLFNLSTDSNILHQQNITRNTSDGESFYFRICSTSTGVEKDQCTHIDEGEVVSVVQVYNNDRCYLAGSGFHQTLTYADGALSLKIEGGDPCHNSFKRSTVIRFICADNVNVSTPTITYVGEEHCFYSFEWVSPAACLPDSIAEAGKCNYRSKEGGSFDLGPMLLEGKNYVVLVPSTAADIDCIQVTPCGHLATADLGSSSSLYCIRREAPLACDKASMCVILKNGTGLPLGHFALTDGSSIRLATGSILSLETVEGPKCGNKSFKGAIDFVCRPGTLGTTASFVAREDSCTVELEWQSAFACPATIITGSDCQVNDPRTNIKFNLTSLNKQYTFEDDNYNYTISFCGSVSCNGNEAALCQTGKKIVSAGKQNDTITYVNGVLKMFYEQGDQCHDGIKRNTTVTFECDQDISEVEIVSIVEVSHCQYSVTAKSNLACPIDFKGMDCSLTSSKNGKLTKIDLSSLIRKDNTNWKAPGSSGNYFIINVCRPLNNPTGHCTATHSVCEYRGSNNFLRSLGNTSTGELSKEGDNPVLTYRDGDSITTTITFYCDNEANFENGPVFEYELNQEYHFTWHTPYACPVDADLSTDNTVNQSCIVTDLVTKEQIDFSILRNEKKDYNISYGEKGAYFLLNICGPLMNPPEGCPSGSAACQHTSGGHVYNAGLVSNGSLVRFPDGSTKLTYANGTLCSHTKTKRKTEILFICPEDKANPASPTFVNETDCVYNFIWPTRLACPPSRMQCITEQQGSRYDLQSLTGQNVLVDVSDISPNSSLVISLCGPVNRSKDQALLDCPYGSAACFKNGTKRLSLGEAVGDFVKYPEKGYSVQLLYQNGDICKEGKTYEVLISFICDRETHAEGIPVLDSYDANRCLFSIRWITPFACPLPGKTDCTTTDPYTGKKFNFADILSASNHLSIDDDGYRYNLSICGKPLKCSEKGEAVYAGCQIKTSDKSFSHALGMANTSTIYSRGWGDWTLNFTGGDSCHKVNRPRTTEVHIQCKSGQDKPSLEFLSEDTCKYYFRLTFYDKDICHDIKTVEVCTIKGYDLIPLTILGNIEAVGLSNWHLYFALCQSLNLSQPTVSKCDAYSGACAMDSKMNPTSYRMSTEPPSIWDNGRGLRFSFPGKGGNIGVIVYCDATVEYSPALLQSSLLGDVYTFSMTSKYACPLDTLTFTSNTTNDVCSITNDLTSRTYNISAMFDQLEYSADYNGYTYHFSLCGSSPKKCGDGIAVCRNSTNIAKQKHYIVIASDGALEIIYTDLQTCPGNGGRKFTTVRISLVCSRRSDPKPYLQHSVDECAVDIFWPTPLLCNDAIECIAENSDSTQYFDLTPLMASTWVGQEENVGDGQFWLRVCRNLDPLDAKVLKCPPGAAVCFRKTFNDKPSYFNLGHVTSAPKVESTDGQHAVIEYLGGSNCSEKGEQYSTLIHFRCSEKNSLTMRNPTSKACQFDIEFNSPEACELKSVTKQKNVNQKNCVFTLSHGAYMNFIPLTQKNITVPTSGGGGGESLTIAVCSVVWNSSLTYRFSGKDSTAYPDSATMVFKSEKKCKDGGNDKVYEVYVLLLCDHTDSSDDDDYFYHGVDSNGCVQYVYWYTRYACSSADAQCQYYNSNLQTFYDLSGLTDSKAYIVNKKEKEEDIYYINICSSIEVSLLPELRSECSQDSAVCLKKKNGNIIDLASTSSQKIDTSSDGKHLLISYDNRDLACHSSGVIQIQIACEVPFGDLKFSSKYGNCNYYFTWNTLVACPVTTIPSSCICGGKCPKDEKDNSHSFYLTEISKVKYTFSDEGLTGSIQLCQSCHSTCGEVTLKGEENVNTYNGSIFIKDDRITFYLAKNNGKPAFSIRLDCVPSNATTVLTIEKGQVNGSFILTGQTSQCTEHATVTTSPPTSDSGLPNVTKDDSSSKTSIVVVVVLIIVVIIIGIILLFICRSKKFRYLIKGTFLKVFLDRDLDNRPVKYTVLAQDEEEASLLESERKGDGDSDEELNEGSSSSSPHPKADSSESDEELLNL